MDVVKGDNAYLQIIVDIKENIMYIYYVFHSLFTMLYIYYNFSYACYKGQDFNQTNSRLTSGGIVYRKQWLNGCRPFVLQGTARLLKAEWELGQGFWPLSRLTVAE